MSKALFLDRDGTLIFDKDYLSNPDDVELIPGVIEGLELALNHGFKLFLFSNQSGVGRGFYTMEAVEACNARMFALLKLKNPAFLDVCMAPEHPDVEHVYRKPSPRFILESIGKHKLTPEECYIVGDRRSDWDAGLNAGIKAIAVETGKEINTDTRAYLEEKNIRLFPDFLSFAKTLEQ